MNILFLNKSVETHFSSKYKKTWKYPEKVKEKLQALETAFIAATSLHDIVTFPPYRFHQLKGKRRNEWSVYLGNTGYRVVLIPCDENGNNIINGDIIAQCKMIKVVRIVEVSNHYE